MSSARPTAVAFPSPPDDFLYPEDVRSLELRLADRLRHLLEARRIPDRWVLAGLIAIPAVAGLASLAVPEPASLIMICFGLGLGALLPGSAFVLPSVITIHAALLFRRLRRDDRLDDLRLTRLTSRDLCLAIYRIVLGRMGHALLFVVALAILPALGVATASLLVEPSRPVLQGAVRAPGGPGPATIILLAFLAGIFALGFALHIAATTLFLLGRQAEALRRGVLSPSFLRPVFWTFGIVVAALMVQSLTAAFLPALGLLFVLPPIAHLLFLGAVARLGWKRLRGGDADSWRRALDPDA